MSVLCDPDDISFVSRKIMEGEASVEDLVEYWEYLVDRFDEMASYIPITEKSRRSHEADLAEIYSQMVDRALYDGYGKE